MQVRVLESATPCTSHNLCHDAAVSQNTSMAQSASVNAGGGTLALGMLIRVHSSEHCNVPLLDSLHDNVCPLGCQCVDISLQSASKVNSELSSPWHQPILTMRRNQPEKSSRNSCRKSCSLFSATGDSCKEFLIQEFLQEFLQFPFPGVTPGGILLQECLQD